LNRVRKTHQQQQILIDMFDSFSGRITKEKKVAAERMTGLAWI
jgi:hypothetical protein